MGFQNLPRARCGVIAGSLRGIKLGSAKDRASVFEPSAFVESFPALNSQPSALNPVHLDPRTQRTQRLTEDTEVFSRGSNQFSSSTAASPTGEDRVGTRRGSGAPRPWIRVTPITRIPQIQTAANGQRVALVPERCSGTKSAGVGHPPSMVGGSFRLQFALLSKSNPWRDGAPTVQGCLTSDGTSTDRWRASSRGVARSAGVCFTCPVS